MKAGPMDVYARASEAGRKTAAQQMHAEGLGMAAILYRDAKRNLMDLFHIVSPAISHRRIQFFYNDNGMVVGYVVWATLSDQNHALMQAQQIRLHLSDWNEGPHLWILDLVAPYGHFRDIIQTLMKDTFEQYGCANYARIARGRRICVQLNRSCA
jgi:hemolysin-activating ACP:hemolysin acyltransferase